MSDCAAWHCAGCGKAAKGNMKSCDCITFVGSRNGPNGKTEYTVFDEPATSGGSMSSGDKPLPMDEAIAHYAGRLSDPMKVERLREALQPFAIPRSMEDNYVKFGPRLIHAARQALLDTEDK